MRLLQNALLLLLAAAWLPLTARCRLEATLPGLEFLQCADDRCCQPEKDAPDSGACCAFGSARYVLPAHQPAVLPVLALVQPPLEPLRAPVCGHSAPGSLSILTAAPPDIPASWRFALRTALPARAPSLLA